MFNRNELLLELQNLQHETKKEFVSPVTVRRINEIRSLLITEGATKNAFDNPNRNKSCGGWTEQSNRNRKNKK